MIASWMAYTALVTALLSIAAIALERVARARGWPLRFVWVGALGASLAWPLGVKIREALIERATPVLPFTITLPTQVITAGPGTGRAAFIDRVLLFMWCAASVFVLLRIMRGVLRLRRSRSDWRHEEIDGTRVRLAPNVGPAVVGLRSMEVVLPEWIVALDAPLRAIVLCHEEEHRRARDPYLLCAAAVAVALMPWNLALWLQARRLRLAIEMDCDTRVLRAHPSAERYGLLMLTIAQRRSIVPALFAPMLSEPTSDLERRILAMRTSTRRLTRATVIGGSLVAMAVIAFACALQSENPLAPVAEPSKSASAAKTPAYFEFQVTKAATPAPGNGAPRYPDLLRQAEIEGEVLAQFVVGTDGAVDMNTFKVLKSTHDLFTAAVRGSLAEMRWQPAHVGDATVKQLVQMPFTFSLSKSGGVATAGVPVIPSPGTGRVAAQQRGPTRMSDSATFFEYQVEKPVRPRPGNPAARYPDELRAKAIQGEVLAQFVVGTDGRPDMKTFKVLKSTHTQFADAVEAALPQMQFIPADVGGHAVKQIVQMPFQFSLTKQ